MTHRTRTARTWSLSLLATVLLSVAGAEAQPLRQRAPSQAEQSRALIEQARAVMADIHDYQGTMLKSELFEDEMIEQKLEFKFSRPFKVYVKYLEPYEGREGIYVRDSNRDRLRAHKGSIPDIAVSLDPRGRVAMMENHHPITQFGLEQMLEVSAQNIQKAIDRGDAKVRISNGGQVHGEPTWRIEIESNAGGELVIAKRGETLWALAERAGQDMFVILHHNEEIDSPGDIREGQKVFVPHYYAGRGRYFVSKKTFMLIKAVSWDHRGDLYELYEFPYLDLNPGLTDRDFDHRSKDYDFMIINQR